MEINTHRPAVCGAFFVMGNGLLSGGETPPLQIVDSRGGVPPPAFPFSEFQVVRTVEDAGPYGIYVSHCRDRRPRRSENERISCIKNGRFVNRPYGIL